MKILWFPRLQFDIDRLHLTTWKEMWREIKNSGHTIKIAVVGKDTKGYFQGDCISVFSIKIKFLRILSFWVCGFLKFILYYFRFRPDAIILDLFTVWFSLPLIFIPRGLRPLIIIDNRTPVYIVSRQAKSMVNLMRFYTKIAYLYCRSALDGMTVITNHYKEQVCKDRKFDSFNIGVWGSGANTERFSPLKYKDIERPIFLQNKFVLMQHGEISHSRGIFETIKAINLINKEDICLLLIGDVVRGNKAKQIILEEINSLNTRNQVYLLPPVAHSEIPKYINYCDCAIMPYPNIEYWNDNNPIKLLEYLAIGKVVICTDMWTFKSVMGNKKCAFYLKDDHPETIADAIRYCYENRNSLNEWGREGIRVVGERYTWGAQANNLLNFIEQLKERRNLIL